MDAKVSLPLCGVLLLAVAGLGAEDSRAPAAPLTSACEATRPNGIVAGSEQTQANSYGNRQL